jgi:hypothetical protein
MPVKLIITPFAEIDLLDIKSWYSSKEYGLFEKFISEFDFIIHLIYSNPEKFPIVYKKYRKAVLKQFPYKIIYSFDEQSVRILAIIHHKRHPKIWKQRIH